MAIIEIPISKLQLGMYLIGMDIPWIQSPFFKHRFLITEKDQVNTLVKLGVKLVKIDLDKGIAPDAPEKVVEKIVVPVEPVTKTTSLKDELEYTSKLKTEAKKQLKKAFVVSTEGGKVNAEQFTPLVEKSTDSLLRNGHALLSVFHEKVQDADLSNHAFMCMALALMIGQRLDINDDELNNLGLAALLMDIGWTKLPPEYFHYKYAYTEEEYAQVMKHVDYSTDILDEGGVKSEVVNIITRHHERLDGSGYYLGYKGEGIPLASQILSLVDHYDSRINGYYDSPSVIPATALKEIFAQAKKGTHDLELCDLLIRLIGIYPLSSAVELNTAEKGVVTKVSWKNPMKPRIRIFYGTHGQPLMKPLEIDMDNQPEGQPKRLIKSVIDPRIAKNDPYNLLNFQV